MNAIFETQRLAFRRFKPDDLEALARISGDEETSRYVGDGQPLARDEVRTWIENSRANVERYGYGTGAVIDRRTGELVGWAGVARPDDGTEEVIYGLQRTHWGAGYGTELLTGLVRWARDVLALEELRATVYPDNAASIAMLERQGFVLIDSCYEGDPDAHLYVVQLRDATSVEVRESPIGGRGVFATRDLAEGDRIRELLIEREITADAPLGPEDDPDHAFLADDRYLLVGAPDRYLNHCCDPNVFKQYAGTTILLLARRDIRAGEELTLDYLINNAGGDSWPCHCGATRCRGMTSTSFFDLPKAIRREYSPLLAPWFRKRYADRLRDLDG